MGGDVTASELTRLLRAWQSGDAAALAALTPVVYAELRRLAQNNLRSERSGHVLQPSALVNEAFVRLLSGPVVKWKDRAHFFGVSARLMRQILVDIARSEAAAKRGNRPAHLDLSEADKSAVAPDFVDVVDLDVALDELKQLHPRQASVLELRFFGGLENSEVAECLGVSDDTVLRDWRAARAWMYIRLRK